MNSYQQRLNLDRLARDQIADRAPLIIAVCLSGVALIAAAVVLGAALAALPQLDAVLEQAEQLHGL